MSPQVPKSPMYIANPGANDDVYDAEVCEPDQHDDDQLLETLLHQVMRVWRDSKPPTSKKDSARPFTMPAGLGRTQNNDQPQYEPRGSIPQRQQRPYFLIITQTATGALLMTFHLPRKVVFAFFIIMFLIVIGISQVPALGDLLFRVL